MTRQKENANQLKDSTLTLQVSHDQTVQNPHLVEIVKNKAVTTSLQIAKVFGKQHAHVLREIEKHLKQVPKDFGLSNFGLSSYHNEQNKNSRCIILPETELRC